MDNDVMLVSAWWIYMGARDAGGTQDGRLSSWDA
jgi:hypothetical protein